MHQFESHVTGSEWANQLTVSLMIWLRVELTFARERGKRWASVLKTKSSMSRRRSSSSAKSRKRYLNVSARTYESILIGQNKERLINYLWLQRLGYRRDECSVFINYY